MRERSLESIDTRDLPETSTHSFIVRIWLEEAASQAEGALWRGRITHVLSGDERYLQDLDQILDFIVPYLEGMGVKVNPCWQIRRRLKAWRVRLWGKS